MRKMILTATLVSLALPLAPAMAARAHSGWTARSTAMRAGPDYDYPAVRRIGRDARVDIHGCLNDWSWCDVGYSYDRGWVAGSDLVADYQGRRRGISSYLGIGVLAFIFGNYWDDHYRSRSFYNERSRWQKHYNDNYQPHWGPRPNTASVYRQQNRQPIQQGRPDTGHQNRVIAPAQPQERKVTPQPQPTPERHKAFQGFLQNQGNPPSNERRNAGSKPAATGQHGNWGNQGNQGNQGRRGNQGSKSNQQSGQPDKGTGDQGNKGNSQSGRHNKNQ